MESQASCCGAEPELHQEVTEAVPLQSNQDEICLSNELIDTIIGSSSSSNVENEKLQSETLNETKLDANGILPHPLESKEEKRETLIKAESFDDDVIVMTTETNLTRSSTFVSEEFKGMEKKIAASKIFQKLESASVSSSLKTNLRPKSSKTDSRVSLASSVAKNQNSGMKLPHAPGKIPKYVREFKANLCKETQQIAKDSGKSLSSSSTRIIKSAPFQADSKTFDDDNEQVANAKKKVTKLEMTAIESKHKITALTNTVEKQRIKLEESEKLLIEKDRQLNEKMERIKNLDTRTMKLQRDIKKNIEAMEKLKVVEAQLAELLKGKDELFVKLSQETTVNEKLKAELKSSKRDLESITKAHNTITLERNFLQRSSDEQNAGEKSSQSEQKLQQLVTDLQFQLKSRNFELNTLKEQSSSLAEENRSLKTESMDGIKINFKSDSDNIEKLRRDVSNFKNIEQQLKQEILALESKLDDEKQKNFRAENILQLRGEYIKTLQDTDEVNKARLVLQAKDIEDLRDKVAKQKKFKAATNEELNNLHNTLKNQELKLNNMEYELNAKDEKLARHREKYKNSGLRK